MGVGSTTKTTTVVGMHFPHVGVSENGGTPQIIHFDRVFP